MASVQSAFTNKNIHTPLSILVSLPMTELIIIQEV